MSFFGTTHSIPDSVGVCFHTSKGAIVYTGDFKFDQTQLEIVEQILGKWLKSEMKAYYAYYLIVQMLSVQAIQVLKKVGVEISKVFYGAEGRIIVASFASNVHRIQQVFDAAAETGRKVAVVGRSMVKVVDIARRLGYLDVPEGMVISLQK